MPGMLNRIFSLLNRYTGGKSEQILGRYLTSKTDSAKVRMNLDINRLSKLAIVLQWSLACEKPQAKKPQARKPQARKPQARKPQARKPQK